MGLVAATAVEKVPTPHETQTAGVVAPAAGLYVPAAHAVHTPELTTPLYVPGSQGMQAATLVAPVTAEYLPTTHVVHAVVNDAPVVDR